MKYRRYTIRNGRLYEEATTTVQNDGSGNLNSSLSSAYSKATPQQKEGTFSVDGRDFDNNTSNNPIEVSINATSPNAAATEIKNTQSKMGSQGQNARFNVKLTSESKTLRFTKKELRDFWNNIHG